MIDITRNITVTAENVEEVLLELKNLRWDARNRLAMVRFIVPAIYTIWELPYEKVKEKKILAAQKELFKVQNLIDRIELVKWDLYKGSDSRFHTMPEDKFRCKDCAAFGFTTMWKDKHGYWELPEFGYRTRSAIVPVKVSLDI